MAAFVAAVAHVGRILSLALAPSGTDSTRSSLAGPRDIVRLRLALSAMLDWGRPGLRAISLAEGFLSSPRSMAALSVL